MGQVAVAMFYVDKVKARLRRNECSLVKVVDYLPELRVGEHRIIRRNVQATIQDRMVIQYLRLRTIVRVGTTVSTRVRELQTDEQTVIGTGRALVCGDECFSQSA